MAEQPPDGTPEPADATREVPADTETRLASGHTPSQPYTIHDDAMAPGASAGPPASTPSAAAPARGGPDPIALGAGLVALVIAVLAATGTLHAVDPRWVLAVGALAVGGTILVVSLRRRA